MVGALFAAGKRENEAFEFAVLPGQGHFSRAVEDRARPWEPVLDFLDRRR